MAKRMKEQMGSVPPIGGKMKTANDPMTGDTDEPMPHEIDSAMGDLQRAEMHKRNPKLMAKVHEATGKKIMDLKSLKALAAKKAMQDN